MATDTTRKWVQVGATLAGVLGVWLFNQALGSNKVTGGSFLLYFLAGLVVFLVTALALKRHYTPGEDAISRDEVPAQEPTFARFLSRSTLAAPLWLGVRLFLAYTGSPVPGPAGPRQRRRIAPVCYAFAAASGVR